MTRVDAAAAASGPWRTAQRARTLSVSQSVVTRRQMMNELLSATDAPYVVIVLCQLCLQQQQRRLNWTKL